MVPLLPQVMQPQGHLTTAFVGVHVDVVVDRLKVRDDIRQRLAELGQLQVQLVARLGGGGRSSHRHSFAGQCSK